MEKDAREVTGAEIYHWTRQEIDDLKDAIHATDQGWTPWAAERELFMRAARSFAVIADFWKTQYQTKENA